MKPEVWLVSLWNLVPWKGIKVDCDHLGVGYLAAFLERQGVRTHVFMPSHMSIEEVVRRLQPFDAAMLGIGFYSSNFPHVKELMRAAREASPSMHITLGGVTASFWAAELLSAPDHPDSVVIGEGELTIAELADRVINGKPYHDVYGLALPGNPPTFTPSRPLIPDLNVLPFPRRSPPQPWDTMARVEHGRGCYASCSYCNVSAFTALQRGPRIRMRSIGHVLDEIEMIQRNNPRIGVLEMVDSNFVLPGARGRERLLTWADEIERRGMRFKFAINARAPEIDHDVFARLKQVGLSQVFLGAETMVPSGLERFNKRVTVGQNYEAIKILADLDIVCRICLILIDPLVTIDELLTNLAFCVETPAHVEMQKILKGLRADRGTPIAERLLQEGLIDDYYPFGEMHFRDPALPRFLELTRRCGIPEWMAFLAPASQAIESDLSAYVEVRRRVVRILIRLAESSESEESMDSVDCSSIRDELRQDLVDLARQAARRVQAKGGIPSVQA